MGIDGVWVFVGWVFVFVGSRDKIEFVLVSGLGER